VIYLDHLNFSVGSFALQDVCLEIRQGEYFVLLGPSGSGKTLLLECLCGLHRIDSGRIVIDDDDVSRLEPRQRQIGYLPQDYALFPHLPVKYNVAFGLANPLSVLLGVVDDPVQQLLEMVGISALRHRLPGHLSGGEQQRVALTRALAVAPRLLLLDEPVSALDEQTRDRLCRDLRRLQRETNTTTIHVCHNFSEMMAVADRVGVIDQGRIVQVGHPEEVLERPISPAIAEFVQAENLLSGTVSEAGNWLRLCSADGLVFYAARDGNLPKRVRFMVRPENILLSTEPFGEMPDGSTMLVGRVHEIIDEGRLVELSVDCAAQTRLQISLGKKSFRTHRPVVGGPAYLAIHADDVHVWPEST
jgi:ABC-type Fe3+/spermidine/putrescine transport system ATPase subunit